MFELFVLLFLFVGTLSYAIHYGRKCYGTLENSGFPVIKPTLFLGSVPNLHKEITHLEDVKRFKKYGPIWGLYQGIQPHVYIADPELIRLIYVKNAENFYNRQDIDFGTPIMNEILDYLPGEKWKTIRSLLSPLFTTSKLKSMTEVINSHAKEYTQDLIEEASKNSSDSIKYDTKKRLSSYLIDMFARTILGIQLENSKDPDNEFAVAFRTMMGEGITYGPLYSLTMSFPFLSFFSPTFDEKPTGLIERTFRNILENRRKSPTSSHDFLDVLNDIWSKIPSEEFKKLKITETTIISQAVNFFLGGYETSSTTLSHLLLFLANHPEIQQKLYLEIMDKFPSKDSLINHDLITEENVPYLSACLNETLRLAPPLHRPERICTKSWTHDQIHIKKGTLIFLASWAVHRNSQYYADPEKFIPERFLIENKMKTINPYAFTAFGHGPRNCIGIRFAYDSLKIVIINLLRNFKAELRNDTKLSYKTGSVLLVNFDPLYLNLVKRK